MSLPTQAEEFAKIMENLRKIQESCAMIAHLHNAEGGSKDSLLAKGWLGMAEMFRLLQYKVTELAKGKLNS